jgi:hypothetical protein
MHRSEGRPPILTCYTCDSQYEIDELGLPKNWATLPPNPMAPFVNRVIGGSSDVLAKLRADRAGQEVQS